MIAHLEDARLGRLNAITHSRRKEDHRRVGGASDLDLGLAHSDRLDDDDVETDGLEHPQCLRSRGSKSTKVTTRGHRPDVDALIHGVFLHADAVTEKGSTGEGRGWINRQDTDPLTAPSILGHQSRGRGRLPHSGGTRDPHDDGRIDSCKESHEGRDLRGPVLHERDQPCEFANASGPSTRNQAA